MKCRNISIRGKESCRRGKNNFSFKVKNHAREVKIFSFEVTIGALKVRISFKGKNRTYGVRIFSNWGKELCLKGKNMF